MNPLITYSIKEPLTYIPNPLQTISESYRVLKPGGIFTIFTYRKDILKSIDSNCKERGREWEKGHHVFQAPTF